MATIDHQIHFRMKSKPAYILTYYKNETLKLQLGYKSNY